MYASELAEDVGGIETSVLAQLTRDNFHGLCIGTEEKLVASGNGSTVGKKGTVDLNKGLLKIPESQEVTRRYHDTHLHLNGSATSDDSGVLDGSSDNHKGVVERTLRLINELLGTSTEDDSHGLGGDTFSF